MFLGHHAAALAAKNLTPRTSLGTLIAAATLLDLAWPILLLLGVERVRVAPGNTAFTPLDFIDYPWTHSLALVVLWSVLFALAYRLKTKFTHGAIAVGILVASHWFLDYLAHRPDLPLYPGGRKVGMGLWMSVFATVIVEVVLFLTATYIYLRSTRARDKIGSIGLWAYVIFLLVVFAANATTTPPNDWRAIAWGAMAAWLFVPWAWWIDRHREALVA
ncbi:MAG TPA: hypothetical protein VF618_17775 [Thermoanaerobaculia bacterium]